MYTTKNAVKKSFKKVKFDILSLKSQIKTLNEKINNLNKPTVKTNKKVTTKNKIISSKTGKKVHKETCAFAKNIMPKNKIYFKTKEQAYNKGYKPCMCMLS
ncbi:MAG: hypothetical protein ACOC3X_01630 [Nanoarchaeota archaeon]